MRLEYRFIGLLCLLSPTLIAQTLDMRTTVRDVAIQATCEQNGSIEFVVSGEAFMDTSPEQPNYIRITFDKGATLCETLVWTSEANPVERTRTPIYLPVSFENSDANNSVNEASAPTVSIARWRAGDPAIWLKITQPADTITDGALDRNNRIRFGLGFSASSYWSQNSNRFFNSEANMPSTTRDPSDPLSMNEEDSVSTLLCLDYSASTLVASPNNPETQTIGNFNLAMFDETTQGVDGSQAEALEGDIILGGLRRPLFSADNPISRGIVSSCFGAIAQNSSGGEAELCGEGLVSVQGNLEFQVSCSNSWGFHRGSEAIITLNDAEAQNGFRVQTDAKGAPISDEEGRVLLYAEDFTFGPASEAPGQAYAPADHVFLATGDHWLSREATLIYDGPSTIGGITFNLIPTLYQDASGPATTIEATTRIFSSNRNPEDVADFPPFDGPDQYRRCQPGFFEVSLNGSFQIGAFIDCTQGAVQ